MAYQMTITLTDAEYQALSVEAAKNGKPLESLLHEVLVQHIKPSAPITLSLTSRQIEEYLCREGAIEDIPTNESERINIALQPDLTPARNVRSGCQANLYQGQNNSYLST